MKIDADGEGKVEPDFSGPDVDEGICCVNSGTLGAEKSSEG